MNGGDFIKQKPGGPGALRWGIRRILRGAVWGFCLGVLFGGWGWGLGGHYVTMIPGFT